MNYIVVKITCLLMLAFLLSGCTSEDGDSTERMREEFNNGRVIDMAVDEDLTRDNWDCTGDCSGHEAGYEWADDKGISDPSDCGGNSESFIEGCEAYANE